MTTLTALSLLHCQTAKDSNWEEEDGKEDGTAAVSVLKEIVLQQKLTINQWLQGVNDDGDVDNDDGGDGDNNDDNGDND